MEGTSYSTRHAGGTVCQNTYDGIEWSFFQSFQRQKERGTVQRSCSLHHHLQVKRAACDFPRLLYRMSCHQDAAKKALQEMFEGKKDVLADYDAGGGDSGRVSAQSRQL
jgi:hypothetical protein